MRRKLTFMRLPALALLLALLGIGAYLRFCGNNPWPRNIDANTTQFSSLALSFKTLDPAVSYYEHEMNILDNVVEMPYEYHYLKRPYQLVPMLMEDMPQVMYFSAEGRLLPNDAPAESVSKVQYTMRLKKGVLYQPHPCFAKDENGNPVYLGKELKLPRKWRRPADFALQGTRELTAEDFKVALTRLCDPSLASPVFSTLKSFIAGMDACSAAIAAAPKPCDYRKIPFEGMEALDKYTLRLNLTRKYPQAIYWLAMHFFAPVPWEALAFYAQPEVVALGLSFNFWPVGTGAFMIDTFEQDAHLLLVKNPNHRPDPYPSEGEEGDREKGLLEDAGKNAPFLDKLYYLFEAETVPEWIKFTQGYYDLFQFTESTNDTLDGIMEGASDLSPEIKAKGISLVTSPRLVSYYYGFNMLDETYGGLSPRAVKLRRAISIAIDTQTYIDIFSAGHGVAAGSIIPPGVPGGTSDEHYFNKYIFSDWKSTRSRRSIQEARQLMVEAGYPDGIGADGKRLQLSYDNSSTGGANFKSKFQWLKGRLQLIGVDLIDNGSDLNRFRDKIATGNWQFMRKGWVADYPDPENFLFLFYSKNGHVASKGRGPNYTNYSNPEYDKLFLKLECMENSPEREALIRQANEILMHDAPCIWDSYPVSYTLVQPWLKNFKPNEVGKTYLRFRRKERQSR